jgi:uncharacterized lipoprotein YajG
MRRFLKIALPLMATVLMTGCFNGSSNSTNNDTQPNLAVDFSRFVIIETENMDDTREPVNINDQEFNFNDQNNEQAFDELFIP